MQTDAGPHKENEDSVGVDETLGLWLVADGMGGHSAGRQASSIARDTFIAQMRAGSNQVESVMCAHRAIANSEFAIEAPDGIGSTLVALQLLGSYADVVWVGDSRCYLWRDHVLDVVSHDHSVVQMLIDRGELTDATARGHPKRNLVTQVLGMAHPVPEQRRLPLKSGDWLLLCSDGLNDELEDHEISSLLKSNSKDIASVADALVESVVTRGGKDNVSAIVISFDGPTAPEVVEASTAGSIRRWLKSPIGWGVIGAIVVFVLFALIELGAGHGSK